MAECAENGMTNGMYVPGLVRGPEGTFVIDRDLAASFTRSADLRSAGLLVDDSVLVHANQIGEALLGKSAILTKLLDVVHLVIPLSFY